MLSAVNLINTKPWDCDVRPFLLGPFLIYYTVYAMTQQHLAAMRTDIDCLQVVLSTDMAFYR
jgi:hypothetical protein